MAAKIRLTKLAYLNKSGKFFISFDLHDFFLKSDISVRIINDQENYNDHAKKDQQFRWSFRYIL